MPTGDPSPARPPVSDAAGRPVRQRARQKHLMTPGQPRPQNREPMSLSQVQKWVLSTLVVITIEHLAVGLVVAALFVDDSRTDSTIGLLVIAGLFGMVAVVAARAIHRKRLLSPWLLAGSIPALVGAYLAFWR